MLEIAFTCKQPRKDARKNDGMSALVRNGQFHSHDTAIHRFPSTTITIAYTEIILSHCVYMGLSWHSNSPILYYSDSIVLL